MAKRTSIDVGKILEGMHELLSEHRLRDNEKTGLASKLVGGSESDFEALRAAGLALANG